MPLFRRIAPPEHLADWTGPFDSNPDPKTFELVEDVPEPTKPAPDAKSTKPTADAVETTEE